jgi:hypothetical protein
MRHCLFIVGVIRSSQDHGSAAGQASGAQPHSTQLIFELARTVDAPDNGAVRSAERPIDGCVAPSRPGRQVALTSATAFDRALAPETQ